MAMVMVAPGARLWRGDGIAATVTAIRAAGVLARVDGESTPALLDLRLWRLALTCDGCDQAAEVELLDDDGLWCRACAHAAGTRADWVRPIPHPLIKALFGDCERLA